MVDPVLQGQYPVKGLYQALSVAAMCVQEEPSLRPLVADVVKALDYLASQTYDPQTQRVQNSGRPTPSHRPDVNDNEQNVSWVGDNMMVDQLGLVIEDIQVLFPG